MWQRSPPSSPRGTSSRRPLGSAVPWRGLQSKKHICAIPSATGLCVQTVRTCKEGPVLVFHGRFQKEDQEGGLLVLVVKPTLLGSQSQRRDSRHAHRSKPGTTPPRPGMQTSLITGWRWGAGRGKGTAPQGCEGVVVGTRGWFVHIARLHRVCKASRCTPRHIATRTPLTDATRAFGQT